MKRLSAILAAMVFWSLSVGYAFAIGEIFKIKTSGTGYCGDFDFAKFSANNTVDIWIRLDNNVEWTLSFTPTFTPGSTVPLIAQTYLVTGNKASSVGGQLFEDGSFVTFQGIVKFGKDDIAKSASGTFIESGFTVPGCFSAGKFKSVERLFP